LLGTEVVVQRADIILAAANGFGHPVSAELKNNIPMASASSLAPRGLRAFDAEMVPIEITLPSGVVGLHEPVCHQDDYWLVMSHHSET
jgi:hypothetical protein